MDVWPLNLKGGSGVPVFPAMRMHEKLKLEPPSTRIEVNVSARRGMLTSRYRSVLVRAGDGGKKKDSDGDSSSPENNDPLIPEEDNLHGNIQPNDLTKKSHGSLSDWRDFRANLVAWEQEHLCDPDPHSKETSSHEPAQKSSLKWAHPIPMPETGCVLVATEKLDGVPSFERTVVLLLRSGSRDIRDGPFGIILNRPLHRKIRHMKPSNPDLATIFADCSVYFGGPLEASMFLVRTGDSSPLPGFGKVVSGVCFGARNSLNEAASLVKKGVLRPLDFRFFVGYAGWQFDQLLNEIDSGYWVVAACSSHLINEATVDRSSNSWKEILLLMGGKYADLSKKPKRDS